MARHKKNRRKDEGFTLVEMSFVLLIVGMVILMVFPALKAIRKGQQVSTTTANLETATRAIAAFVQSAGCLPCPTPASTIGEGFGRVRGSTSDSLCGTCKQEEGLLPFISLGLPSSVAKDGWGHWLTLRITPSLAVNFGVVPPTSPCLASDGSSCTLGMAQKGLCSAGLSSNNRVLITHANSSATEEAAFVLVSHGENGYGAYQIGDRLTLIEDEHPSYQGPVTSCGTSGGFEACNSDDDLGFTVAPRTDDKNDPFDDRLIYMSRNALVAYLGQSACQTEW